MRAGTKPPSASRRSSRYFISALSGGGRIERHFGDDVVADRNVETPAELAEFLLVHFFLLVRNVFAFARFAEAVAFDRFRQNHRRLAFVLHRRLVGGIHFAHVVAAAQQLGNLLVAQMVHQFEQLGIFAEEMFARVAARLDDVFLVIAVHAFFHALEQQAGLVALDDVVPFACPKSP